MSDIRPHNNFCCTVCVCCWQLLSNVGGQLWLKLKQYITSKFLAESKSCDRENNWSNQRRFIKTDNDIAMW